MKRFLLVLFAALLVPAAGAQTSSPPPLRLTLRDAIRRGLAANLRGLVAQTRVEEGQGAAERRFAALLPRVRGEAAANLQNRNLRAFGISFPGTPAVVGPFSNFDFRVYADQPVLDLQSYRNWKASTHQVEALRQDLQDARDFIVQQIGVLYLNAQSAAAEVDAADARVASADALLRLARDRHDAGVATGLDVLRAQVQLANEQQRLLENRNSVQLALLALARNVGLSPGSPIELAEALQFVPLTQPELDVLLSSSLLHRADYLSLSSQRLALAEQQRAARARYYPKFSLSANYGELARSIGDLRTTGFLQGTVSIPIFDRDRNGEAAEIAARLRRVDDQIADLRRGIEEDLREATLNLQSAADQVAVAGQGRELAQQELQLAEERFRAGVANNIEVTQAQDALARAQENYILALARHVSAKLALARAAGGAEQNVDNYLGAQ
jgi:outer membrane protein TolC